VTINLFNKPQSVQTQPNDTKAESTRLYTRCIFAPHFGCLMSGIIVVYNLKKDKVNQGVNQRDFAYQKKMGYSLLLLQVTINNQLL
jgi:hypothetical protein